MNRRGFFGLLAAVTCAPKALRLVPAVDPARDGLTGWLTHAPDLADTFFDDVTVWNLPGSHDGRLQAAADLLEDGLIDTKTFAELVEET